MLDNQLLESWHITCVFGMFIEGLLFSPFFSVSMKYTLVI